jgi:hypothetical protein
MALRAGSGGAAGAGARGHDSAAKDRAVWRALREAFPDKSEDWTKAVIAACTKNSDFEVGEYEDPVRRAPAKGILSAKLISRIEGGE